LAILPSWLNAKLPEWQKVRRMMPLQQKGIFLQAIAKDPVGVIGSGHIQELLKSSLTGPKRMGARINKQTANALYLISPVNFMMV
jgi:hypothetical protein